MNKQVKWAASPYLLWMAIFIIVPLALIAVFAFTTTYTVDVVKEVSSIAFTAPTKTEYAVGESLDVTGGKFTVTYDDGNGGKALALINPHDTSLPVTLEGEWNLVADGETAGSEVLARESGTVSVSGISVRIYVNDQLVG